MKPLDPTSLTESGEDEAPDFGHAELPDRYERRGRIGIGGMGEVIRVYDRVLERELAMKILGWRVAFQERLLERFVAEAGLCARLQHPGIVPVHDRGELPDGRPWFTMPEVRGRTLDSLIAAVHAASAGGAWQATADGWTLRRLVTAFASACGAVAYAHANGVLHRDLKPDNLMVGAFGEVQVMDWGIAAVLDGATVKGPPLRERDMAGTPAYMAPEQARGLAEAQGPWTDVYALGSILYALLAGRPPYSGDARAVVAALLAGPPEPLAARAARPGALPVPDELAALAEAAMARDPAARPPDAGAVADALRSWLDGERRRARALALVAGAAPLQADAARLRAEAAALLRASEAQLSALPPRASIPEKVPFWRLEERARSLQRDAAVAETRWLQAVQGALAHDDALPEAHAALAAHYQRAMAEAEGRRDPADSARYELLLRAHDRGEHAAWLSGEGRLSLTTDPPRAAVVLLRVVQRDRRLIPIIERPLGRTPIHDLPLAAGTWMLRITAPGHHPVDLPVQIGRGERWARVRPGDAGPRPLRLPPAGALRAGDRLVPGGWCWLGGDALAVDPLPRRAWWVDSFIIRRDPVTNEEYVAFLDAVAAEEGVGAALALAPAEAATRSAEPFRQVVVGADGRVRLGVDGKGEPLPPTAPVTWVDRAGAVAYARWRARRDGLPWRLPHDHEWEKAGRGVDGRLFPWGDHFEASWAVTMASHAGAAARAPVDACPADESPYGVRGLAGNVRDWCWNAYERDGPGDGGLLVVAPEPPAAGHVVVRGGSYISGAPHSRLASRFGSLPGDRLGTLGFRLCRPWPAE